MNCQKYIVNASSNVNLISICLLCFTLSACIQTQSSKPLLNQQKNGQFSRLFKVNDLNEHAFAYYQYCLKKTEPINKKFLENMEYTVNQLLDLSVYKYGWKPEYAVQQILKRRTDIQQQLSEHYHIKGCHSLEGNNAEENYRFVSEITKKQIK